jgi:hypothetical protein
VKKRKEQRERDRERENDRKKWKKRGKTKIDQTVFNRESNAPSNIATERDSLITNGRGRGSGNSLGEFDTKIACDLAGLRH